MSEPIINPVHKRRRRSNSAEQLLGAASQVLTERNSADVSLSDISQASGLNSALIKYHYGSKDGLLLALVRHSAQASIAQLEHLVSMTISPEHKVRFHIHGIMNTYVKYPYLNRLIHGLMASENENVAREIADFFIKPLTAAEARLLQQGVNAGVFREVDPLHFYYAIIGACDHFITGRRTRKFAFGIDGISDQSLEAYADFISDMAIRMLRKDAD